MAYNLADRFPKMPKYYPLLDPGTYEKKVNTKKKGNVAPFLSKTPRVSQLPVKIWTHVIYSSDYPHRIPNCSAMMSRTPRFPYELSSEKFSKELLCDCDTVQKCECTPQEERKDEKNEPIDSKRYQRIIIGSPPRVNLDRIPCAINKNHKVFEKTQNIKNHFGHNNIREFIALYRKSKGLDKRVKPLHEYPGPATYNLTKKPTETYICAERVRAHRRKTSKQCRFIELIQQKNIRQNFPGPANYSPQYPKGMELQFYGPKAERFGLSKRSDNPGPNNYEIKRDFDLPTALEKLCHVSLPIRSPFGVKAPRFKSIGHEGPRPAHYNIKYKNCPFTHCQTAPFGSSSLRFTNVKFEDEISDKDLFLNTKIVECEESKRNWMFKSQTIRIKPLKKMHNEQSPADMPPKKFELKRSQQIQNVAPFGTSKMRFEPWYNWISVYGTGGRPGPGEYKVEEVLRKPAMVQGPLSRCERFKCFASQIPPPNAYEVNRGLETILRTHNKKLKENITKNHEFHWQGFKSKKQLSDKERESHLINRCLTLLSTDIFSAKKSSLEKEDFNTKNLVLQGKKNKMLKCFLYKTSIPNYF